MRSVALCFFAAPERGVPPFLESLAFARRGLFVGKSTAANLAQSNSSSIDLTQPHHAFV